MSLTPAPVRSTPMADSYLRHLLAGDRSAVRSLIDDALEIGMSAYDLLTQLAWPTMEAIQHLFRENEVSLTSMNMATRLNRSTVDRLGAELPRGESNGRSTLIFCGDAEPEELGGQITADLFESAGWHVRFAGGGVPNDEVLAMIGKHRPDLLVMFATRSNGVPAVRQLIDYLREVNGCPQMQVMCCGGIYKRAEGLAEEIGADLYAADAATAVEIAAQHPRRKATVDQQTVGRTRRIRQAAQRKTVEKSVDQAAEMPRLRAA